jgi:hypothetical protein
MQGEDILQPSLLLFRAVVPNINFLFMSSDNLKDVFIKEKDLVPYLDWPGLSIFHYTN